jgi:manganese-dependent inorganic pyrophosphatase
MADVKVFGHSPADTDSTCSPIVFAWYLSEYKNLPAKAFVSGDINREAKFVLEKFGVAVPDQLGQLQPGDKVAIVDTNNPEELPDGISEVEIVEIVDHHRLFGLKTNSPLNVTIRTYGSVPTVMWEMFTPEAKANLPKQIAGLMLAPIVSDTLNFTSSTTTEADRVAGAELAKIAEINIDELAKEMFAAKSDLTGMDAKQILLSDYKDSEFGGEIYRVGVLETTDPSQPLGMIEEFKQLITQVKQEESLAGFFFFIVDIVKSEAHLVRTDAEVEIAKSAFAKDFDGDVMLLPGAVSRKKDLIPKLAAVLE